MNFFIIVFMGAKLMMTGVCALATILGRFDL